MGMVSHNLLPIQSVHFHTAGKSYHNTRWIAGLITQLLQVTHMQWIYRCMLVHDRTTGILISTHKANLLNRNTTIRVRAGTKNSRPIGFLL